MGRAGFEIARIGGIRIRVDVTFLLVLPFLAWILARSFGEAARVSGIAPELIVGPRWAWGLGLALGLFVSVLLHELAHCWLLLRRGGRVGSITLLMIGGVTEMTQAPRDPTKEAGIALAGPAASLLLGAAAAILAPLALRFGTPGVAFALFFLGRMNLMLGIFNLLPAFPMDGGRILRGVLARRRSPVEATRIAASLGKVFAVLFAAVGFLSTNLILILVAFFVFAGAKAEEQEVLARAVLGDLRVREIMTADPSAVAPEDTLFAVADRMLRERRVALPVSDAGRFVGFVRLEAVERLPVETRRTTPVRAAMQPAATVAPGDRVVDAIRLLGPRDADHLAVAEEGRLVGVVSAFDFARGLQLGELAASQHAPAVADREVRT
jgi:Zn-dependent protease